MSNTSTPREEYARILFPAMMSYVPGGIRYDLNKPMVERIQSWIIAHKTLATMREQYSLTIHGGVADESTIVYDTMDAAITLATSTKLRQVRNKWKQVMKNNNWDCGDHLWRRDDGRDANIWAEEWIAFREAIAHHIN